MFSTKKVIAAGAISFAFASAFIGAPKVVHAAGDDVDAAVFVAPSGPVTPGVRAILSPDCAAGGGSQTAVICTGGHGGYTFASGANPCVGVSTDDVAPVVTCGIVDTNGSYTNIICGTGTAFDNSSGTTISENGVVKDTINYSISFFSGVGVLTGSSTDGGTAAGVVLIVPTAGNCVNTDVTTFEVIGVAAVTG